MPASRRAQASPARKPAPLPRPPAFLQKAYAHLPLPVSVTALVDGRRPLVWANPEFVRFYGIALQDCRGLGMDHIVVDATQLREQSEAIRSLNEGLGTHGLSLRHFRNRRTSDEEVGVLVIAHSVHHRGREFRVGIALPDSTNELYRWMAGRIINPEFNETQFYASLSAAQLAALRDLANGSTPEQAGTTCTHNGARNHRTAISRKLAAAGAIDAAKTLDIRQIGLIAFALGPRIPRRHPTTAGSNPRPTASQRPTRTAPRRRSTP